MKLRLPILILAPLLALPAAGESTALERGESALADGLWEVAALRFQEILNHPDTPADDKARVALRLAESWIRGGLPADALELLGQSFVENHPEAYFWRGQAQAGVGRFADAVETLGAAMTEAGAPHRKEALFSRASLQLSLNQSEEALRTLAVAAESDDPKLSVPAKLRRVEILIDQGRTDEARENMPTPEEQAAGDTLHADFLEATLLLAEGKPEEAAARFAPLLGDPSGQSLSRHHAAALGMADSLAAMGNPASATESLLLFIQNHPDSPQLEAMFRRLLDWLPEQPTASDPLLERLRQWIPSPLPASTGAVATWNAGAAGAWPVSDSPSDLAAFSLFTRAIGLHRMGTPESLREARFLMTRLRLEHGNHFLVPRSLLILGRWMLEQGDAERAFALLDSVRDTAKSPLLRGDASFLQARASYDRGDLADAAARFDEAADSLTGDASARARYNAAIARLRQGEIVALIQNEDAVPENHAALQADLELEQALSTTPAAAAKTAIEAFLTRHPDHPRETEARLAAAEAALASTPPDLSLARAQLDTLEAAEEKDALPSTRIALVRLRLMDASGDPAATIQAARAFLETHGEDPATREAALILGRNLFQSGDYNDARLVLQKLALADTEDPARAQAAWLLAARSAALGATTQSREEALGLFDKAAALDGPLVAIARLEKARLMIDLNRLPEAIAFLRDWFQSLAKDDPLRLAAGLLLGEAIFAQGSGNPDLLAEALAIYDPLIASEDTAPALRNRLQYLRGMTLEQLPRADKPGLKREAEALDAYYSVLEAAEGGTPAEWEWFERCGFRALELLEKAERWEAAIKLAERIAAFQGPRSGDAADRARQIRLKHMIWED